VFLGPGISTRADEVQQQRLYHLIKHGAFGGNLPTERKVSELFRLPAARSRTLLRNVLYRFSIPLDSIMDSTLRSELSKAKRPQSDRVTLFIRDEAVLAGFNKKLDDANDQASERFALRKLSREQNVHDSFLIPLESYEFLCKHLGVA